MECPNVQRSLASKLKSVSYLAVHANETLQQNRTEFSS